MGDLLMQTSLFEAIKNQTNYTCTLLVSGRNAEFLENHQNLRIQTIQP